MPRTVNCPRLYGAQAELRYATSSLLRPLEGFCGASGADLEELGTRSRFVLPDATAGAEYEKDLRDKKVRFNSTLKV